MAEDDVPGTPGEPVGIAVVGAGAAGLSLAHWLARRGDPGMPTVALVEPAAAEQAIAPRTWCWWEPQGGPYDAVVHRSWERVRVYGRDGARYEIPLGGLRYKMLRSADLAALVARDAARTPGLRRITGTVTAIRDGRRAAELDLDTPQGLLRLRADWVFDSRPLRRLPPARTTLLQHFRGWFVRSGTPAFDPSAAVLMDFRVPQPPRGAAFGYLLPLSEHEALVEYTGFSREPLTTRQYDTALTHYTGQVLGLGAPRTGFEVTGTEQGVIPMTDARFERRAGERVFRIGTAGGATRPSTGYTFATVQRQSEAVADALLAGRNPLPPRPHRARHLAMDAALLRALDTGRIDGAAFFEQLFQRNPAARLLRFLDGRSSLREEIAVGLLSPVLPMALSCLELPLRRRRPVGG
ncbi:FAD-dependent oxidoreductase [Streptomyces sp. NBC_01429]|uniref:FAD-dependent oxidoreductase n=1 Tax=Streptomyces sp. NBC_01429 TaxID=2903862 RepID=UPI002E2D92AB|nr:FAD-dependent oxidoreductase [Streptomyces sp. NBC_01429]